MKFLIKIFTSVTFINVLTLLIILTNCLIGHPAPFNSGGIPFTKDSTSIQLVDADIEIGIAREFVDFIGIYKFFNPGRKYTIKIIFPPYYFPTKIKNNPVYIEINNKWHKDISIKGETISFRTTFKSKDTTIVKFCYKIITDLKIAPILCKYSLVSGTGWQGRIKKCNIEMTFCSPRMNPLFDSLKVNNLITALSYINLRYQVSADQSNRFYPFEEYLDIPEIANMFDTLSVFPDGFEIDGASISWCFTNFEPDFNILVPIDRTIWDYE